MVEIWKSHKNQERICMDCHIDSAFNAVDRV